MGQFNAVLKDWRVVVSTLSGAEVFEFEAYEEAMSFARQQGDGVEECEHSSVLDKVARVVWSSSSEYYGFDCFHGVDDAPAGVYRWNDGAGWFEVSTGDWAKDEDE